MGKTSFKESSCRVRQWFGGVMNLITLCVEELGIQHSLRGLIAKTRPLIQPRRDLLSRK
jgi:hypothetical protein